jgi:hypothetical protein
LVEQLGDEVLTEQPDGPALDRFGRIGVTVGDQSRNTTEQVAGDDAPAVVRDAPNVNCGRIPGCLNDLNIVEQEVHLHGSHRRCDGNVSTEAPPLLPSAR